MFGGNKPGASMVYPYDNRYRRTKRNRKVRIWEKGSYERSRDRYLTAFRSAAMGLRGDNPAELSPLDWWAVGRHHGLITPLLDWTEKPYIAAFFALSGLLATMLRNADSFVFTGRAVAVYRLWHADHLEDKHLKVHRPQIDELKRMQGQKGVFTFLESEDFFELQGYLDNKNKGNLLTKFTISDQALFDGLRDMDEHGIDHRLLFPDLSGAASYANLLDVRVQY